MKPRARSAVTGSSLIEVVVAMGVSAIGLLAMAGLLAVSTKVSRVNQHQAQAVVLAQALAERVRANPGAAAEGDYAYEPDWADEDSEGSDAGDDGAGDPSADPTTDLTDEDTPCAISCTPAQRAEADVADWLASLGQALPRGTGRIRQDTDRDLVDIVVAWTETGDAAAPSRHRCPAAAGLPATARCVRLRVAL